MSRRPLIVPSTGRPNPFWSDPNVVAIATEVCLYRETELLRFAKKAMLFDLRPTVGNFHPFRADLVGPRTRIAGAGHAIQTDVDAGRRRGATLELIVFKLVQGRARAAIQEGCVRLAVNRRSGRVGLSKPKDVLVDADPVEVYECKSSHNDLDQDDINELTDIHDTIRSRGREPNVVVAVLASEDSLRIRLHALKVWHGLFRACESDIVELGNMPSKSPLTS